MVGTQAFARAFGDSLLRFLERSGKSQAGAAKDAGIARARLNTYLRDSRSGKRAVPSAEVVYLVCDRLGFEFEYMGCRITGSTLKRGPERPRSEENDYQLSFDFERQFSLTDGSGSVSVSVKRPVCGYFEVSVSLKAAS